MINLLKIFRFYYIITLVECENMFTRYGYPFAVMVISGLLVRLLNSILTGSLAYPLITIVKACYFFALGLSMFQRKRSNAWVKKLIIAFLFLFFVFWDCGYIVLPQLKQAFDFIGISGFVIYMFYVFCGYTFFD